MLKEKNCTVLKKFFVEKAFRSQKVGLSLYNELLKYANSKGIEHIILDTPAVAHISHRFYEKAGFKRINSEELPVPYSYPDRDSILYLLNLSSYVYKYFVKSKTIHNYKIRGERICRIVDLQEKINGLDIVQQQ